MTLSAIILHSSFSDIAFFLVGLGSLARRPLVGTTGSGASVTVDGASWSVTLNLFPWPLTFRIDLVSRCSIVVLGGGGGGGGTEWQCSVAVEDVIVDTIPCCGGCGSWSCGWGDGGFTKEGGSLTQ